MTSTMTRPAHSGQLATTSVSRRWSVPVLATTAVGAVLTLVAMLSVTWYQVGALGLSWGAQDLTAQTALPQQAQTGLEQLHQAPAGYFAGTIPGGFAAAVFGWLAFVLLAAAVVAVAIGLSRVAKRVGFAVTGAVLAVAGLGVSIAASLSGAVALAHTLHQPVSVHGYFDVIGAGTWVAVAGFAVLAIAAITAAVIGRRAT